MGDLKYPAIGIGLVAVAFMMLIKSCDNRNVVEDAAWQRSVDSAARVTIAREARLARVDTVYDTAKVSYVQYRDRILRSGTATARDSATFEKVDVVVAACDTVRVAAGEVIEAKTGQLQIERAKPGPRRVQGFGEALYSIVVAAPVVRLGATVRAVGPVYLSVAGELETGPEAQYRVLAGVRINF